MNDAKASEDNQKVSSDATMNATSVDAGGDAEDRSENTLDYDVKEITLEVLRQMRSDFAKVVNFVVPEKLREKIRLQVKQQIWPAIKPFVSVAKGMTTTTYGMARRYFAALVSGRAGGDEDAPIRDARADEEDNAALVEQQTTAA